MVQRGLEWSGHDEVALTSLSTADFSGIEDTVRDIVEDPAHDGRVSVSLPSLRVDAFTVGTAAEIQKVRRTGLTFAPEGGTWRMRKVINKLITEEDLYGAVDAAFSQGWRRVKLYFLIGLPTEQDEDVLGIAELGARCAEIGRRYHRSVTVVASVGGFVPKPHTPFQWFGMDTAAELERKVALLRARRQGGPRPDDPLARPGGLGGRGAGQPGRPAHGRGDRAGLAGRRHVPGVVRALRPVAVGGGAGGRGPEPRGGVLPRRATSTRRSRGTTSRRGCTGTSCGGTGRTALARGGVEDCRWTPCYDCGACTGFGLEHVVASAVPPAGGSQGTGPGPQRGRPHPGPARQPCLLRASAASASASPRRGRSASPATGTSPACGSGRCGAAGCRWPTRRASAPSPRQLRAGPADGLRVPWRVPRRAPRAGRPGRDPRGRAARAPLRLLPDGIEVQAAALVDKARVRCSRR